MRTKEEKQPIYDIIATINQYGFTQTQILKALKKIYPFVKPYYIQKAKRYGKVKENLNLLEIFQGSYSKLTKTYFVRLYLQQGKSKVWIKSNLGEDYYDLIWILRRNEKNRKRVEAEKQILSQLKGIRTKKINLDMIIDTLKEKGHISGLYYLRQYVQTRIVKYHLKKYGLTIKDVLEKDKLELKSIIVENYCKNSIGIIDYEGFLKALYSQEPLSRLDRFIGQDTTGILRDRLKTKTRGLTKVVIDSMIVNSTFDEFKLKFEDHLYRRINNAYFKGNQRERKSRIKKDICSIEEFIRLAIKYGYAYARRRFCDEKRNELFFFIKKNFGSIERFKALLKENKIFISAH